MESGALTFLACVYPRAAACACACASGQAADVTVQASLCAVGQKAHERTVRMCHRQCAGILEAVVECCVAAWKGLPGLIPQACSDPISAPLQRPLPPPLRSVSLSPIGGPQRRRSVDAAPQPATGPPRTAPASGADSGAGGADYSLEGWNKVVRNSHKSPYLVGQPTRRCAAGLLCFALLSFIQVVVSSRKTETK